MPHDTTSHHATQCLIYTIYMYYRSFWYAQILTLSLPYRYIVLLTFFISGTASLVQTLLTLSGHALLSRTHDALHVTCTAVARYCSDHALQ